jgi:hypothetical protein
MRPCFTALVLVALVVVIHPHELLARTVVVDENIIFNRLGGNEFRFRVSKTAENSGLDETLAYFADFPNSQSIAGIGSSADEGSDWYVVQPGDLFSRATVASGQFPLVLSLRYGAANTVFVGPDDFYLGVRTGIGYDFLHDRDAYGWVHLGRNESDQLIMLENVMSYENYGIYVGTTQIIPEPTAAWLSIGLVGAGVVIRRPRRSRCHANS